MASIGLRLLTSFPKCSQDLNAIETAWREVRARLSDTEPQEIEDRTAFMRRLRNAVSWVNSNRSGLLQQLCQDQKDRARDVLENSGGRTGH